MAIKLFLSHRMDTLVDRLVQECDEAPISLLQTRTILVPHASFKQWLLLEIAKRKGIAMGWRAITLEELFPSVDSSVETYCRIYNALREMKDPDVVAYLDGKQGRLLNLSGELAALFAHYRRYGQALFDPNLPSIDWQHALLRKVCVQGSVPTLSPLIAFGIDEWPPLFWEALLRAPSLSLYLFSPCAVFWGDLYSDREKRSLHRRWKKEADSLDAYLSEAPRNLANWGRLGRETLKMLDRYDFQTEELYPPLEPDSLLKRLQANILYFQEPETGTSDDSIKIFLTGSSRLKEVECLREEILRLNIPYQDISVLAPNLEPYIPLIEFVFSDIPYRISGFDIAPQSSFRQGLLHLLRLAKGRWQSEEILSLLETPAFYRKQGWDTEQLESFRSWIEETRIQWGADTAHRKQVLDQTFGEKSYVDHTSWEKGFDRLLDGLIYLSPLQVDADLFEAFLSLMIALKKMPLQGEKTLAAWADSLEIVAREFLLPDLEEDADGAAYNAFLQLLRDLRQTSEQRLFPIEVIERLLLRPCSGQIHASYLHAVRFSPLETGALFPAKALFLIGMDEESFPRSKPLSSLDLLKRQKIRAPDPADRDRYLFLQAFFSAADVLRISYGHLSADEGKPVNPSLLVQELSLPAECSEVYRPASSSLKRTPFWPDLSQCPPLSLPEGEVTISLADLRLLARHPWKFFLQKVHGIYLHEPLEESFALQKSQLIRATLEKPIDAVLAELPSDPLGEALKIEIREKALEWQEQITAWQLTPFTWVLQESNALELTLNDRLKVRLVGDVKQATTQGLLCAQEDHLGGLLKVWPDALAVAIAFEAPSIWMLKNGKQKKLHDPLRCLKAFIEYYFRCLSAPSPLLPDWADALLRKGGSDLEKKIQKGPLFDDPVFNWVLARAQLPPAAQIVTAWAPSLKETFDGLLQME